MLGIKEQSHWEEPFPVSVARILNRIRFARARRSLLWPHQNLAQTNQPFNPSVNFYQSCLGIVNRAQSQAKLCRSNCFHYITKSRLVQPVDRLTQVFILYSEQPLTVRKWSILNSHHSTPPSDVQEWLNFVLDAI